jgi:hypothetical protein
MTQTTWIRLSGPCHVESNGGLYRRSLSQGTLSFRFALFQNGTMYYGIDGDSTLPSVEDVLRILEHDHADQQNVLGGPGVSSTAARSDSHAVDVDSPNGTWMHDQNTDAVMLTLQGCFGSITHFTVDPNPDMNDETVDMPDFQLTLCIHESTLHNQYAWETWGASLSSDKEEEAAEDHT